MFGGDHAPPRRGQVASSYSTEPLVSLFHNAHNVNITNSHFTTNVQDSRAAMLHLGEHCAMGALYKSLERDGFDAPRCHPNTRVAVINRLIDWMTGKFYDRASLWLYGAAGAGKSAIAHTIAEICEKHGWLLATFFFSKTESERNNVKRFVATIAYQIALAIPTSREYIEAAVDHNPWIFDQSIDTQFSKLIIEPLQRLHSTGFDLCNSSFVIIIDGLDECSGNDIQTGIVRSLADAFRSSPYRIRILIASRPEVYLQSAFNYFSTQLQLSRLALSDEYSPEQDIYRFLEDSFRKIRLEHPQRSSIPPSWPGTDALHDLTRRSSGQFIFASTAVSYTGGDPYELPTRRLDVICQLQPPRGEEDLPYAELNSLYHHVLSGVRDIDRLRQILGVLLTLDPLGHSIKSTQKIDGFFFWQPGEAKACLSQLASIIKCGVDGKISILHASLSDFLLDPSRSHGFYLCQESVLGDIAAIGMCHLRQQVINKDDYSFYTEIIPDCLDRSTAGTPALQQELSLLSFQRLYDICKMHNDVILFWFLSSSVFEMLDNQALEKQFTHLVADLIAFCFQAFLEGAEPDKYLAVLVYHAQHSQLLHVQPPNPASAFSVRVLEEFEPQIRLLITRIITMHPERHRFSLTIQNYVTIAVYFMQKYPDRHGLCPNEAAFGLLSDYDKRRHSDLLSALLCIAHVLPLACGSEKILQEIVFPIDRSRSFTRCFHQRWPLDGWNDSIVRPALDAVREYYKCYAKESDVNIYMRLNGL